MFYNIRHDKNSTNDNYTVPIIKHKKEIKTSKILISKTYIFIMHTKGNVLILLSNFSSSTMIILLLKFCQSFSR